MATHWDTNYLFGFSVSHIKAYFTFRIWRDLSAVIYQRWLFYTSTRLILITFFKPWSFKVTLQYTMVYFVVLVLDWCADGTLEAAIKCYIIQHRFVFYYVTKECIWYTFLTYGIIMRGCWHTYLQKIFSRGILEIKSRYVMLKMCFS